MPVCWRNVLVTISDELDVSRGGAGLLIDTKKIVEDCILEHRW